MAEGYVYILTNRYVPDLVKIGYTDRDPGTRANELSNTTGVPGKWAVHKSWLLEDAYSCEQRIFSELAKLRETGEFFRLSPQGAVEKVSALLASWGAIDASGLSAAAKREAEQIQRTRYREQAEREEERRKWQAEQDRRKAVESLATFFQQVSQQIKERETSASNAMHEKWKPWFRQNCIKNAFIWGIGVFLVGLTFVKKEEGAMLLGAIAALFAYGVGDNYHSDEFQIPHSKAKKEARNAVLQAHQLGYLMDKSKITSTYRDHRGFTVEPIENWERVGYSTYDPKFKNKRTGEEIGGKSISYVEYVGYFDKSGGRLLVEG